MENALLSYVTLKEKFFISPYHYYQTSFAINSITERHILYSRKFFIQRKMNHAAHS